MSARGSRATVGMVDHPDEDQGPVFESLHDGANEIQVGAGEGLAAPGRLLGRMVYNTTYAISFSVTFPVMMIVRVVPRDNALVHGLVDGALAARDRAYGWHDELEEDHHDSGSDGVHAFENGATHHEDSSEHATHRRPRAKRSGAPRKSTRPSTRKKS